MLSLHKMYALFLQIVLCQIWLQQGLGSLDVGQFIDSMPPMVSVETSYGMVQGFIHHQVDSSSQTGMDVEVFLGIPYARPPVGELRFEKPEPPLPYTKNSSILATRFPPACASYAPMVGEPKYSEDCLYLNVFKPATEPGSMLPVVMWIHGGNFEAGSTQMYGIDGLASNFVSRGIIAVSVQYRLGMYGFFSTGDKMASGNMALWDLRAALLWVKDNIAYFGGDPNKVTLWGENSGSALVSAMTMSKWTSNLFSQAIEMSGSMFSSWANSKSVVESSSRLARMVGCTGSSKMVLKCMKMKSAETISKAGAKMGSLRNGINYVRMQMHMDDDFFNERDSLEEMVDANPPKRTIQGFTSQESMLLAIPFPGNPSKSPLMVPKEKWESFGMEDLEQFVNYTIVPYGLFSSDGETEQVRSAIMDFYARRNVSNAYPNFYLNKYTQMLSDMMFMVPSLMEALKKSRSEWPVYLYMLDYMNPMIKMPVMGTYQAYELSYLFGLSLTGNYKLDKNDKMLQQMMVTAMANFIKTGDPSMNGIMWSPMADKNPLRFLDMKPEPMMGDNLMLDRLMFWADLRRRYPSYDLLRGTSQSKRSKSLFY